MGEFRLALVFLYLAVFVGTHAQQVTTAQRRVGPVQCLLDSFTNTLTSRFVTLLNGDDINHVYGCQLDPTGSECTYNGCQFLTETVTVGSVSKTYMTVESVVDLSVADPPTDGANQNACGFTVVTDINGNKGYKWRIALRKEEEFLWSIDNDYLFTCYQHQSLDTILTNVITVTHDNLVVDQTKNNPTVNMYVLRKMPSTGVYERSTSCIIGEDMKLEIEMVQTDHEDYLLPWGLYPTNTRVAPLSTMASADALTDGNGCIHDPNSLELGGPFTGTSTKQGTLVTSVYLSGVFQCKRYLTPQSNQLHFDTMIQFCIGQYNGDTRCINYCSSQTGRRRRDVNNSTDINVDLTAVVTVIDRPTHDNNGDDEDKGLDTSVMIIVGVVAAVVVLLAVLAAIFACVYANRRHGSTGSDVDSCTSSKRNLPVY